MLQQEDFKVQSLGAPLYRSPLHGGFVSDTARVRYQVEYDMEKSRESDLVLDKAGPREHIFFDPEQTAAAVVTCGGLSPGLNNVIRSVFYSLHYNYHVPTILGIRYGYLGMNPEGGWDPVPLTHDFVEDIDKLGGTVLGSSRGPQQPDVMVEFLLEKGINMLFCVGGEGTQRGANALYQEITRRELPVSIVGIPKTIDNDIPFVWQSFGYATAMERAVEVINGAHVEARSAVNGIGLVKLMGRDAGFIAAGATLGSQEVNFTLIPEVPFPLEGRTGFLEALENRIRKRGHAVVVVAEGAGQHLFEQHDESECDPSGNPQHQDIGLFLKHRIEQHFAHHRLPITLKYLDPSYYIRSAPANTRDRILSDQFGRLAVDAAMCGKTNVLIGMMHNQFVNVPIGNAIREKKRLDVGGDTWESVLRETRQPRW
jgi:6-phosphofructokinase 1